MDETALLHRVAPRSAGSAQQSPADEKVAEPAEVVSRTGNSVTVRFGFAKALVIPPVEPVEGAAAARTLTPLRFGFLMKVACQVPSYSSKSSKLEVEAHVCVLTAA